MREGAAGGAILPPLRRRFDASRHGGAEAAMDFIEGVIEAGVTIVALVVVIGLLAALFMIVFGIATGIDDRIQS
jgi:hypothetical protein